jgi:hypothetical protein
VKDNEPTLHAEIEAYFLDQMGDDFARVKVSRHETKEQGHGRVEHRTYFACDAPADLPDGGLWKGLQRIGVAIHTRCVTAGRPTTSTIHPDQADERPVLRGGCA